MPTTEPPDTEQLLELARQGDRSARGALLERYRRRLSQMIAVRMDVRLAARLDPSDVVQESLADAMQEFSDYLRRSPMAFYPWLRQLALDRLQELHRRHIRTQKRSVKREQQWDLPLSDQSAVKLAEGFFARSGSTPSQQLQRHELQLRVHAALAQLSASDREILELRHLEQLSPGEIAAVLGITEGTVYVRHLRAALLSVLEHEVGHALGLDHDDEGVMSETLEPGERPTMEGASDHHSLVTDPGMLESESRAGTGDQAAHAPVARLDRASEQSFTAPAAGLVETPIALSSAHRHGGGLRPAAVDWLLADPTDAWMGTG